MTHDAQPSDDFPDEHSLCESCGYSLRGMARTGNCPECGDSIDDSHPRHRPSLAWQHRMNPATWLRTSIDMTLRPGKSFRKLRLDGRNTNDRLFLLSYVVIISVFWESVRLAGMTADPWWTSPLIAVSVVLLSYIEGAGVTYFSRQRGWRVGWRTSERLVCYAAVGWLPAAMVLAKVWIMRRQGVLERWMPVHPSISPLIVDMLILLIITGLSILWFETLVWLGVRQTRHGNAPGWENGPCPPRA